MLATSESELATNMVKALEISVDTCRIRLRQLGIQQSVYGTWEKVKFGRKGREN